jgi:hypothetical protein
MNSGGRLFSVDTQIRHVRAALFTGTVAALCSSLVVAVCGRLENGRALAPHNGPAQWIYGSAAGYQRSLSCRHTLVGFAIHHVSSCWWAYVHRLMFPRRATPLTAGRHLAEGALIAIVANVVDYRVVPERIQPGFDKHVSRTSMAAIYVAFGLGLALGNYLLEQHPHRGRR